MANWPAVPAVGTMPREGGIEPSNSWIYWVSRRCPWNGHGKSLLERWNWEACLQTPLDWRYSFEPRYFTSLMISTIMTLVKNFCTRHWMGPSKSASNRAPHLLMPALVSKRSAGPD